MTVAMPKLKQSCVTDRRTVGPVPRSKAKRTKRSMRVKKKEVLGSILRVGGLDDETVWTGCLQDDLHVLSYVSCMYTCMCTCYSAPSRFLFRGAPDYSADTESEFHAEAHEPLRVKDLPRVPTRGLRWIRTHN